MMSDEKPDVPEKKTDSYVDRRKAARAARSPGSILIENARIRKGQLPLFSGSPGGTYVREYRGTSLMDERATEWITDAGLAPKDIRCRCGAFPDCDNLEAFLTAANPTSMSTLKDRSVLVSLTSPQFETLTKLSAPRKSPEAGR